MIKLSLFFLNKNHCSPHFLQLKLKDSREKYSSYYRLDEMSPYRQKPVCCVIKVEILLKMRV